MNFLENLGIIIDDTRKEIKKITIESKNAAENVDKEWLETLNKKCVLKTNNKVYTAKEGVIEAKKQRDYIIASLASGNHDSKAQLKLGENLVYLNKVISSYESNFEAKEADKKEALYTDGKAKKGLVIKTAIEKIIVKIDEQINDIVNSLGDLKKEVINCENKEDLERIYKNSERIVELKQFKNAMQKLLGYNGEISSSTKLSSMKNGLTEDFKNVVDMYYTLITDNNIDMEKLNGSKRKTTTSKVENIINEINYYFAIAKDKNSKEALDYATSLIKEVEDEETRNDLEAEAALIATEIYDNIEKAYLIKEAERLVEIAESTEKARDFKNAYKAITELPEGNKRTELSERLLKTCEKNKQRFDELMGKILNDIADDKDILSDEIYELTDRYQYLNSSYISTIDDDYNRIITVYNNQVQNDYQKGLTKEDIKKHSAADMFREMMGGIVNFVAGTKIARNINKKILKKLNEKLTSVKSDKKKARIQNGIDKINNSISESDVVSGFRLFGSRNRLAKKKLKLYKEGFDNSGFKKVSENSDDVLYQTRTTNRISKLLTKGLSKKLKDESIAEDKSRVITILDQYLELISSGTYDESYVKDTLDYLEQVRNVLSDSEYNGYFDEIQIIGEYRKNNNGMPYHMNNTESNNEVDDVIRYYDSDAYAETMRESRYIKRK